MSKPRVIFVNRVYSPSQAATAQLLTDLAEGLARRGWQVHVIVTGRQSGEQHGVAIHRTGEGEQHGGMISRARNYWRFIRRAREELASLVQPGDVVVVMTDPPLLGAALTGIATRRGAHVVHWIQDIYPEIVTAHLGALLGWPLFPLRMKRDSAWHAAQRCVVLGETMAREVANHGVATAHLATVPNWAPRELHTAATPGEIAAQRADWGLTNKFVIAYSGNLGRVHEFNAIIEAASVLQTQTDTVFLFIGTGARLADVRAAVQVNQLRNVRFLPPAPREKLAISLAAADVQLVTLKPPFAPLVYPSKLAGVLAAGRPVIFIGPTEGEIDQLLKREECGATIAPGNGTSLAGLLTEWRADSAHRIRLGQHARLAYEKHFTADIALAQWEGILGSDRD